MAHDLSTAHTHTHSPQLALIVTQPLPTYIRRYIPKYIFVHTCVLGAYSSTHSMHTHTIQSYTSTSYAEIIIVSYEHTYMHACTHTHAHTQQCLSAAPKASSKRDNERRPQTSCSLCSRSVGKVTAHTAAVTCWMPASPPGQGGAPHTPHQHKGRGEANLTVQLAEVVSPVPHKHTTSLHTTPWPTARTRTRTHTRTHAHTVMS